jgi:hypothetical protein
LVSAMTTVLTAPLLLSARMYHASIVGDLCRIVDRAPSADPRGESRVPRACGAHVTASMSITSRHMP